MEYLWVVTLQKPWKTHEQRRFPERNRRVVIVMAPTKKEARAVAVAVHGENTVGVVDVVKDKRRSFVLIT